MQREPKEFEMKPSRKLFLLDKFGAFCIWLFFVRLFSTPQSFQYASLPLLCVVLVFILIHLTQRSQVVVTPESIHYFLILSVISILWIIIGAFYNNNLTALLDAVRLYVVYNFIYFIFVIYLTHNLLYRNIVDVVSVSSILIALIAFYTIIDSALGLHSIPAFLVDEMFLQAGLHKGYTQLNNVNVSMYAFLLPFLGAHILLSKGKARIIVYVAFIFSVAAIVIASRRMIIIIVFITPALTLALDVLIKTKLDKVLSTRIAITYALGLLLPLVVVSSLIYLQILDIQGFANRLASALDPVDQEARHAQFWTLLEGFKSHPVIGSGFGGETAVVRSTERPWSYELTYLKLLFNAGAVGTVLLVAVFMWYILKAFEACRRDYLNHGITAPLLAGFFGVLIASSSNPYLNSFDFLFSMAIVPLVINLAALNRASA